MPPKTDITSTHSTVENSRQKAGGDSQNPLVKSLYEQIQNKDQKLWPVLGQEKKIEAGSAPSKEFFETLPNTVFRDRSMTSQRLTENVWPALETKIKERGVIHQSLAQAEAKAEAQAQAQAKAKAEVTKIVANMNINDRFK